MKKLLAIMLLLLMIAKANSQQTRLNEKIKDLANTETGQIGIFIKTSIAILNSALWSLKHQRKWLKS